MKKIFYFLLFMLAFTFAASAQRFEYQLGLKGGVGAAYLGSNDDNIVNKDNGITYKFGLTGTYYFKESYGFTSGFNILGSDISYKYKVNDLNTPEVQKRNLKNTYLQIPLLLKMRTDNFANRYHIFGEIGYGVNIFVDSQDKNEYHHDYRDVCSSFIVHFGFDMVVLNRSTLVFLIGYDNFFTSMMTMKSEKMTMSNLCFEVAFLF